MLIEQWLTVEEDRFQRWTLNRVGKKKKKKGKKKKRKKKKKEKKKRKKKS